ncbi:zinc-binding alcohol dehydrogenase family protein [Superficieibacter sp.]|uniref:quinone oxidoreductase family protein n=1 Tax=Superficieibacter sp. TaxID=2303322 RepID=UPI0028A88AB2|nr:zinc-binding alcohol dehydrogenase family protein [Superficieibacter sp.]
MKAAVVYDPAQGPVYADFPCPEADETSQLIQVQASAISHVVKSRAAGRHYSFSSGEPFVAGIDGVGLTETGERVWFAMPVAPWGSMAEWTRVPRENCLPLPPALSSVDAAALGNPGMSAWASLVNRAGLQRGETVLINGATGSAGRLAVQIARYLGAGKIIATGRHSPALEQCGADVSLLLQTAEFQPRLAEQAAAGIDVVIDYLWGESAEQILQTLASHGPRPLRYVQVGALAGSDIRLPGAVLRSSAIQLMGSGIGSLSMAELMAATNAMLQAAMPAGLTIATTPAPLSDVAAAWPRDDSKKRTVFLIP